VLDSQFRGMKDALENPDPAAMQRVKDMLADLNQMLEADARGEHTQADFDAFMDRYGDMFPDNPANLEELVDALARRAMAAQRLMASLSPEQRDELAALMQQTLSDEGMAAEMARLGDALRARRPELDMANWPGETMTGNNPLDLGDATTALADLADLAELEAALRQDYPAPGSMTSTRTPSGGPWAGPPSTTWRRCGRPSGNWNGRVTCSATRASWSSPPRRCAGWARPHSAGSFADLPEGGYGDHEQRDAGQAGEYTGATRPWQFGDEQSIDAPATVRNALLRDASAFRPQPAAPGQDQHHGEGDQPRVRLSAEDFEVGETERRASAAVCLLVDLSYSMAIRGTWGVAKQTALALHALVRSRFPQDSLQVIGFSNYARELRETDLAGLGWDMVQGTNLHHALVLAGRYLDRASRARSGRAHRDRRRAHRPPAPGRELLVRLAARAGDAGTHPGRGGQDDQAPGFAKHLHARRRRKADRICGRGRAAQWRPGPARPAGAAGRVCGEGLPAHPPRAQALG
jgi:uncharacterized protein with von Willebrand factor type A (vWA) domain